MRVKGHRHSEETKRRISESKRGKPGPKPSEETKKKMSESHRRNYADLRRKGIRRYNWKGRVKHNGYIQIYSPGHPRADERGRIFEHIIVWETVYNRKLQKGFIIHHLNGIKDDNRPENLIAMKKKDHCDLAGPYKKRIRELEFEVQRLRQRSLFDD